MKSTPIRFRGILAAGILLGLALAVRAQDGHPARLTEGDYADFTKLRLAKALVEEKSMFAHGNKEKQAAIDAQFDQVLAETGWTKDRFGEIDDAVGSILNVLGDPEQEMDPELDKTTIATVKAHRKELADYDGLQQRARQQVRDEQVLARRGRAPTAAEIAGTWVLNIERSVASVTEGTTDELTKNLADEYRKNLTVATYTFGPGNTVVAVNQRPGVPAETTKGTYRLEGSTLFVKARMGSRDREDGVEIGIRDGRLYIGMMGVYSVFDRK